MTNKQQKRKVVKGKNERELKKFVKEHERRGWRRVGKICELHGISKSEYMQVMELQKRCLD